MEHNTHTNMLFDLAADLTHKPILASCNINHSAPQYQDAIECVIRRPREYNLNKHQNNDITMSTRVNNEIMAIARNSITPMSENCWRRRK